MIIDEILDEIALEEAEKRVMAAYPGIKEVFEEVCEIAPEMLIDEILEDEVVEE